MWKNFLDRKGLGVYSKYIVEGRNIDTLINILSKKGIYVKNIKKLNEKKTTITIKFCDNEKFFAITKELWYTKRVKDYGVGSSLLFLSRNLAIFIGVIAFVILSYLSNDYIFSISFSGTGSIYEREIIRQLDSYGVEKLSRFSELDLKQLSNKLLSENGKLNYISLKKQGNTLLVNAVKKSEQPTIISDKVAFLKADCDGVVESVIVYRGTAVARVGDKVKKGDLLVDGYALIKEQVVAVNVFATISIVSEYNFEYLSNNDNEETLAMIFATERLNREIISSSVNKKFENEKYRYVVTLKYRNICST